MNYPGIYIFLIRFIAWHKRSHLHPTVDAIETIFFCQGPVLLAKCFTEVVYLLRSGTSYSTRCMADALAVTLFTGMLYSGVCGNGNKIHDSMYLDIGI